MSTDTQKLRVIRSRTDHDLQTLVQRELNRGLASVEVARSESERAYASAMALLPKIANLSPDDRMHLELKLRELRLKIDQAPKFAPVRFAS